MNLRKPQQKRPRRPAAFTFIEVLIAVVLTSMLVYVCWSMYVGGFKQVQASADHFTAMQNSLLLMERIQEDIRQIAILKYPDPTPQPGDDCPISECSLVLSPNRKSFSIRKSTATDPFGSRSGSSFVVVTYQLVEHPFHDGLYTIRREVRTTNDDLLPDSADDFYDEKVFSRLTLADIRYDFLAQIENMSVRQFFRVSITTVDEKTIPSGEEAEQQEPRLYYISNVFQISPPETPYSARLPLAGIPNSPRGFAAKGPDSAIYTGLLGRGGIGPLRGFWQPIPGPADYRDRNGVESNLGIPSSNDPFRRVENWPALRQRFLDDRNTFLYASALGPNFRGLILGQIPEPRPRDSTDPNWEPGWHEAFSIDATEQATEPVMLQVNDLLGRLIPRGPEAVAEMGHYFTGSGQAMITTAAAAAIVDGR